MSADKNDVLEMARRIAAGKSTLASELGITNFFMDGCFAMAKTSFDGGHYWHAEDILRGIVGAQPGNARYRHLLVAAIEKQGRTGEALKLVNEGLKLDPMQTDLLEQRARLSRRTVAVA